jgi:hypothetical protein
MRYAALTLTFLLLIVAAPLSASWWPSFSTTDIQIYVGEKASVKVSPTWSGLVDLGGVHWTFASDNPAVATGEVHLESAVPQDFDITGVSPGVAHIRNTGGWPYVTIRVACPDIGFVIPVAAQPVVQAELGRSVHLAIVMNDSSHATFHWYRGTPGDTSHLIAGGLAEMTYVPQSYGTQYVWAAVTTICSTAQVEFRVDVFARQRSVRH